MSPNSARIFSFALLCCGWLVVDRPIVAYAVPSPALLKSPHPIRPIELIKSSDRRLASTDSQREGLPRRRADGGSR